MFRGFDTALVPRTYSTSDFAYALQPHQVAPIKDSSAHAASPTTGTTIVSFGLGFAHLATSHT